MNIRTCATPCTLFNKWFSEITVEITTIVGRPWTFDSMGEMIKAVTSDLDGEAK